MNLAQGDLQNGLFMIVVVLCAITVMLMLLRRRQFRQVTGRDLVREQVARLRDQHQVRASLDDLLLQLEQLQREINAQLDTKFARLEAVVRDADDRIARLGALLGRQPAATAEQPEPAIRAADGEPAPQPPTAARPSPAAPSRQPAPPLNPEHRRVYDMTDAGHSPIKVAEALGLTLGEVELILNLREPR